MNGPSSMRSTPDSVYGPSKVLHPELPEARSPANSSVSVLPATGDEMASPV